MAKLATLIDDFQDGTIDVAKWTTIGNVAETGGRARLTPTSGVAAFLTSLTTYDITSSQVIVHAPVITANGSTGTLQSGIVIRSDPNNLFSLRKVGSDLICSQRVAGIESQLAFVPYNAVTHAFWRFRVDGSTLYWETASNPSSGFSIQNTVSTASFPGFNFTAVTFYIFSSYSGFEAFPGTFQIESVNPGLPLSASGASTSSGSLDLLITAPLEIHASGLSTSTGSLAFTLVVPGDLNLVAAGASTSTGSLSLSLSALPEAPIIPGGVWIFRPPIAYDNPPTLPEPTRPRYLNAHAKWKGGQARGRNVLKYAAPGLFPSEFLFPSESVFPGVSGNPTYVIVDTLTVDQMAAADFTYQGGHVYEITGQEAYYLNAAGFTVTAATDILTTEDGDILTTESGDILIAEYSL